MTRLGARALNRATLARQLLLHRADLPVLDAVQHLCGLQAQEPQEPFAGLCSRLRAFDPEGLSGLLTDRRVVRTTLMRRTIHLVTAEDALARRARHDAMLRQRMLGVYRGDLNGVDLDEVATTAAEVMAHGTPRTMPELGRVLAERWPGRRGRDRWVRRPRPGWSRWCSSRPAGVWRRSAAAENGATAALDPAPTIPRG
ncbi:DNA glycosylase AlkZ-like family protein [Pseudonocardia kujensis]|uniref:DNA glycosylase AlkZ-like family protein n=1 Tax=Pseudonocardia kujensis TaxID=1128675 RepID=UPI0035586BDA